MLDCRGRSGTFGVVVLKASMLDLGKDLPVPLQFGIAVFKACMLDWWGVDLASLV